MITIHRKGAIGVASVFYAAFAICFSFALFSSEALAQAYPTKPVRIVVTSTPGSGGDIMARLIGGKLTESLGQQFIVDNRAGAGGRIGAETAAKAAPDGYTLMMMTATLTIVNAMYEDLKYNLVRDFLPVSLLGSIPFILVVNPSLPATSVKELVSLAKSRPGALKYGSGGSGSTFHLSAEIFKFMTGTDILHVPYKGGTPPLTNTMTGEVDLSFQPMSACLSMINSGKLRALGVTSAKRTSLMPDLPSIAEFVPGYEFIGWYALVAPAKTSPAILAKLNAEAVKAVNTSVVRERMISLGIEPRGSSQHDLALHISEQLEKMKEAVKVSGARPED
jgi:tripartite-type tricarboxylate transporter receptor subunit TctC